jgi:hypothetical protein
MPPNIDSLQMAWMATGLRLRFEVQVGLGLTEGNLPIDDGFLWRTPSREYTGTIKRSNDPRAVPKEQIRSPAADRPTKVEKQRNFTDSPGDAAGGRA